MADHLLRLQAAIVKVRLIRNQVTVIAVDHRDHVLGAFDDFFVFQQPGFGPLALGDVLDDGYARLRRGRGIACRARDANPDWLGVFAQIALLQLELRRPDGPGTRGQRRGRRAVFFVGKVGVGYGSQFFLRVPHHFLISAIRGDEPALQIRYGDAHGRIVEQGAPAHFAGRPGFLCPLPLGNVLQDNGYSIDALGAFDRIVRSDQIPPPHVGESQFHLASDDSAPETLVDGVFGNLIESLLPHAFRDEMPDDLFPRQAVIVEERLVGHHVAVLTVQNHHHFVKNFDHLFVFQQPGFGPPALGNVLHDGDADFTRVCGAGGFRNRDSHPNNPAVFTPITLFQLELRQPAGPVVRGNRRGGRTVFLEGKVDVGHRLQFFLRVPHHFLISAIRSDELAAEIRYGDAYRRVV